jgi:hypothetical protein
MGISRIFDSVINTVNSVWGTSVIYTYLVDSTTSTLKGVFDNAFIEVNGVTTKKPVLTIKLSDLDDEPVEGDTVLIGSVLYMVRDHQPDSFGSTTLILEKN